MRKLAVIDIGTNTFHLLIAEVIQQKVKVVYKEKTPVKLGEGGISQGYITAAAQTRAIATLKRFQEKIASEKIDFVFASATSAVRNAENGESFIEEVLEKTGISIQVISGQDEAKYIQRGVKKALKIGQQTSLIMDIGGGSVEFIICDENTIFWMDSFEIGAQRLLDKFHSNDPIPSNEITKLQQFLNEMLHPLIKQVGIHQPKVVIGSSGTFDTLIDIWYEEHDIEKPDHSEFELTKEAFNEIFQEIIHKTKEERLAIPGMIEMRVDMIVVASCLIDFILKIADFQKIRVSTYALKEGLLDAILANEITKK